ncbi:uncharacterized protein ARMOST_04385 [Armillaria ostoyae]|uniref:Uncharacterized protein n=1 Tax=Armillaria ostoyae TaxID=47428 RepID=A0A284QX70_ARMOS|nr:uncharacterized protein ARMOST_04385 [Armillaria ostoyae]
MRLYTLSERIYAALRRPWYHHLTQQGLGPVAKRHFFSSSEHRQTERLFVGSGKTEIPLEGVIPASDTL